MTKRTIRSLRRQFLLLSFLALPICTVTALSQSGSKPAAANFAAEKQQVKVFAEQFIQAAQRGDVNGARQMFVASWLEFKTDHRSPSIQMDPDGLTKSLASKLVAKRASWRVVEVDSVVFYPEIRASMYAQDLRELCDKVLGDSGWIVYLTRFQRQFLLIRKDRGNFKIVAGPTSNMGQFWSRRPLRGKIRQILENAEQMELLALEPYPKRVDFHDCLILNAVPINDPATRVKLAKTLINGLEDPTASPAICFDPHHGLRASWRDMKLELVICFDCGQVVAYVSRSGGQKREIGELVNSGPREFLDDLLGYKKR